MKQEEIDKLWELRRLLYDCCKILEKQKEVIAISDVKKAIQMYVRDGAKEELILKELGIIKDDNLEEKE